MVREHVEERIAEILQGTLTEAERDDVEAHLRDCAACREAVDFANQVQASAEEQCLVHPLPDRLVEIADGAVPSEPEQEHVNGCEPCADELRWLNTLATQPSTARSNRRLLVGGVGAVLAAAVVAWFFMSTSTDLSNLAVLEPLPVNTTRSSPTAEAYEMARARGLDDYAGGNYAAAIENLREALRLRPEIPDLKLYLGSALLLQDNARAAEGLLEDAAATGDGLVRDASLWQLANARLVLGKRSGAVEALTQLQETGGRHADRGAVLLQAIRDSASAD